MSTILKSICQSRFAAEEFPRRLTFSSIPSGDIISHVDLDITLDCNLQCTYCYKRDKQGVHIEEKVAFDAVIWLLHACATVKKAHLAFMGGEPLVNYSLIKKLVPFARRRAAEEGVDLKISMTTNCTLVSDEVINFFKKWRVLFHTSIDGIPEVQDANRPTVTGHRSSHLVEKGVARILEDFPDTTARCTVVPETVQKLAEGYLYFRKLGYTDIFLVPGEGQIPWEDDSIAIYEEQLMRIADVWIDEVRRGTWVIWTNIGRFLRERTNTKRGTFPCGAGIGMVAIDIYGNIWPCGRMTKKKPEEWCFGSIYGGFNETLRKRFLDGISPESFLQECDTCIARGFCLGGCLSENLDTTDDIHNMLRSRCQLAQATARVGEYVHGILYKEKNPLFMKKYYSQEWETTSSHDEKVMQ